MSLILFVALAMDASVPIFLGWSNDDSSVAFLQHGIHDGSGFPFVYLEITGPHGTNRYFYEYFCYEEERSPNWLLTRARETARAEGIPGDRLGKRLKVKMTDTMRLCCDSCPGTLRKYSFGDEMLYIVETHCEEINKDSYGWPGGVVRGTWRGNEVFSLPLEGNGFSWWLEDAYSYKGKFALILGHLEPGFEGPDSRFRLFMVELR
ncbi:MAG: hypothetical protein ACP5QG_05720 [candidate division WOR-3 bacterium]